MTLLNFVEKNNKWSTYSILAKPERFGGLLTTNEKVVGKSFIEWIITQVNKYAERKCTNILA